MGSTAAVTEADILSRVIGPDEPGLTPPVAGLILAFDFPEADRARMSELSAKASEGSLTEEEQQELDAYERVGHFLSLLRSKARRSLAQHVSPSE